jgi:O-antigen biosynthesis protein
MLLFSIVIPVYNRCEQLAQSLSSVAAQSCRDFEVIVVDNASVKVTHVVGSCGMPVRLLALPANRGPGAARNQGIKVPCGEYVAFLDSDDTGLPWTLAIYKEAIIRGDTPSFLAGREAAPNEWWLTQPPDLRLKLH